MEPTVPGSGVVCISRETGEVSLVHGGRSREEIRDQIAAVGKSLLQVVEGDPCPLPVEHEFVDGMYIRKLFIPKGTLIVGKIHRKPCVNFVERGDIAVLTEFGSRRCGPGFMGVSHAGIQKLGYAYEDTVFVNVFRVESESIEQVEEEVACDSYDLLQIKG
jgi:hypothetical protein